MKKIIFLLLLITFPANLFAVDSVLYQALKSGNSIKAIGMGDTFTAYARGSDSILYNPAGVIVPGAGLRYNNLDYKKAYTNRNEIWTTYFSPFCFSSWAREDKLGNSAEITSYSYARRGRNGVHWGINYKTINYEENSISHNGWSSDLGILVNFTNYLNFGIDLQDVFSDNIEVPTSVRTGFALFNKDRSFTFATDLIYEKNKDVNFHYGLEYKLTGELTVRGGAYGNNLTAGFSMDMGVAAIDTAIVVPQNEGEQAIYMIGFNLGKYLDWSESRKYVLFPQKAFAEIQIAGNLIEGKSEFSIFGGKKIGSNDLLTYIYEARTDKNCQGFFLRIGSINSSLSTISIVQEIRSELEKAKEDGKIIIVYLEDWVQLPEYYLASVAHKVIMPELGRISHLGIGVEVQKTKGFLDKFGIEADVITSGKYKGMLNTLSDKMTDDDKAKIEELVRNLYHQVIIDVKEDRGLDWDSVSYAFDGRIISAKKAKELGLVDELGYEKKAKELAARFTKYKKKPISLIKLEEFLKAPESDTILSAFNKIAVIEIDGPISLGKSNYDFFYGTKKTTTYELEEVVEKISKDFTIRGVLLRINSPGGSLIASDKILKAVEKLKKAKKIVYTSMGNMALSGGYYVSLNSDKIIANPGTLTGSIGVISIFQQYETLNKILGIEHETIKTGQYMDLFSVNRKMTAEERKMFTDMQQEYYDFFVNKVVEERNIKKKTLEPLAQGQVFSGEQAVELKLIDKLGSFYDAVFDLAHAAKIKGAPKLVFYRRSAFPLKLF
ncbi:signal peptide peptidase SppA [Candidatus Margulisiibacteriota bacterium]